MTHTAAVEMSGIVKRFGPLVALGGVDLEVLPGEIHGLLGENGAGKTTLMNVLYGLIKPDAGTVSFGNGPVELRTPQDAIAHQVGMVHQHFKLVPTLTVTENVLLGQPGGPVLARGELKGAARRLTELGNHYGLGVDPSALVWQLSVGEQQRVEILRALYHGARILVLDEPTATLTPVETEQLLPKLRAMAAEGTSIVFITHHLEEVLSATDRITVLRRGKRVETVLPADTTTHELARLMVGRDVSVVQVGTGARWEPEAEGIEVRAAPGRSAKRVLEVEDLHVLSERGTPALQGVSLTIDEGEIVAIAGVEGNGQAELEEILFGLRAPAEGRVLLDGGDVTHATPHGHLSRGMGLIPSDRYRRGLIAELSVCDNLVLDRIDGPPLATRFRLRRQAIRQRAHELVQRYSIQVQRIEQPAATLSGGNAQRVVLARALSHELRCLVAAQPTRGLDVGAVEFVWEQLDAGREAGIAVLLVSTDLDEVFALADRCLVMYGGRIVAEWPRAQFDRDRIGLAMGGVHAETGTPTRRDPAPAGGIAS
jgi:general nucleoside transport system ATP-binding protein